MRRRRRTVEDVKQKFQVGILPFIEICSCRDMKFAYLHTQQHTDCILHTMNDDHDEDELASHHTHQQTTNKWKTFRL